MRSVIVSLLVTLRAWLRDRAALQFEILALSHQRQVLERSRPRRVGWPHQIDRSGSGCRTRGRMASRSRHRQAGDRPRLASPRLPPVLDVEESLPSRSTGRSARRPRVDSDDVGGNPLWGAPRIHGELRNSGSTSVKRRSRNTCRAASTRRHRPGARSWPITSTRSGRGLLRRADRHLSTAVRAGDPRP